MIAATVRWIHSIHAFGSSSGGSSWPWHSGQSGQPRPESVARTMTPIVDEQDGGPERGRGELLEAGHVISWGALGRGAGRILARGRPPDGPERRGSATLRA